MRFVDQVRVVARAGRGGDGAVAWRREKYVPKGGPAGGDGGRGGDVVLVADPHLSTLLELRFRQRLRAEDGQPGGARDRNGRGGEDLVVKVPVGTMVYVEGDADAPLEPVDATDDDGGMVNVYVVEDPEALARLEAAGTALEAGEPEEALDEALVGALEAERAAEADEADEAEADDEYAAKAADEYAADELGESEIPWPSSARPAEPGELLGDLSSPQQRLVVARGGRGGRGNIHFRSSTNQAPDRAESGRSGEAWRLRLELKLLADVGIVGFPNVGKSTLIRRISRARPKVGAYPFTTLIPNLGVVALPGDRSMVVADVPGLVRGASEGRGLGHQFLRHLERTRVLLHLLAPDYEPGRDPLEDLEALEHELRRYGSQFDGRPRVVALNKRDLLENEEGRELVARTRTALRERDIPLFVISARTGAGIPKLLEAIWRRLGREG
ncbi:MAG: Obg family GTPase CgtA [Myxococcales bacterium]|nr:Obg family GTPase CgtA [Myxococcales bacterium]